MGSPNFATMDGNEAAARVAYQLNEVIAIYPITPASPMGEYADAWSAQGKTNLWGLVPKVQELQSEGGAAGTVHGSLQAGALTTTFTASQGLLLMYPNMFKIAGELTPAVFHIAARSVATHALSIFGDHSDVMAVRSAGWGQLFANSVQEVMDFALLSQAISLRTRVPFLHVFDGFRTSHEISKIELLESSVLEALIDSDAVHAHRERALTPDSPQLRGTAQNPDVFFQSREAGNPFWELVPQVTIEVMEEFAQLTGRVYRPFDYVGAEDAERVLVMMGSGVGAAEEAIHSMVAQGEKVGLVKVRLFRPFSPVHLLKVLPESVTSISVLDRTKEPGAAGEPLFQDVVSVIAEAVTREGLFQGSMPTIVGGRYGLGSKEFTPAMAQAVLENLKQDKPKTSFSVGIHDDVSHRSLDVDVAFRTESDETIRAMFWGLGSDGTVSANKNTIKIIGESTDLYAQGYFVYDSKKSGARTISHLRFGPHPIQSTYLIDQANFVGIHQFGFLEKYPVLREAAHGAKVLLNSPFSPEEVWDQIPHALQEEIIKKDLQLYVIDAYSVAEKAGLRGRINTVMQVGFFSIMEVIPANEAMEKIKAAIQKTYSKRGRVVVQRNWAAVDQTLEALHVVPVPKEATSTLALPPVVSENAPPFVQSWTSRLMAGEGDLLPVSAMPVDGTFPTGTTQWEKRNLAREIPVWDADLCIQCGKCVAICPHAVIRGKRCDTELLNDAPEGFLSAPARWKGHKDEAFTLQVAVEDCTGCQLCVEICPARDKSQIGRKALGMEPQAPLLEKGKQDWDFFLSLPEHHRSDEDMNTSKVKDVQLLTPLFEFSGACAGCGETPYLKLLSQLTGDRSLIANATGCSSIYGGNLPTTPWAKDANGRGPSWSNSLFEDNAEFGLGMRLAVNKRQDYAIRLLQTLSGHLPESLVEGLLSASQETDAAIEEQRERVAALRSKLEPLCNSGGEQQNLCRDLFQLADALVRKSVWLVGGDGWAYDIGFGGLDHAMASGENVNILVLDTEVYSNTGGQSSKATPRAAVAKFAAAGKTVPKKDLCMVGVNYGNVYVARVAMGANEGQTLKAFLEAESYEGPSLIVAYSPCIAHGIDMSKGVEQQKKAVDSGYWPLFRFDPRRVEQGLNPMQLDCKGPKIPLRDYVYGEMRYRILQQVDPDSAKVLLAAAQKDVEDQWDRYRQLAEPCSPTTS
ncbi:MAG: pyruvate:ferredoxin (flavodoxin) oxidoreductase [Deltaproteobacteria bacterium]|nr:MAG: pyruvate:ferredoxin (flavodoxin) oxidoreductase [Deltaproteobacteria bacterium]